MLALPLLLGVTVESFAAEKNERQAAFERLQIRYPGVRAYKTGEHMTRLYGRSFASGSSPELAAEDFRLNHSRTLGADAGDLIPVSLLADRRHTQPLMYIPETGEYKFTLIYYSQYRDEVPVFRSELRLLARNEPGYPVVLAVSTLRELGDFRVADRGGVNSGLATSSALARFPSLTDFSEPETVIWAGIEDEYTEPVLALAFTGYSDFPERWLFVADAMTGEILYEEDQIIFEDVYGNVSGIATEGSGAEHCEDEVLTPMPYSRVNIGSTEAYADSNGSFLISNAGTDAVEVVSPVRGEYFIVYNYTGTDIILYDTVVPPGPANFIHNFANTEEVRAQINAYIESNIVRDLVMTHNPSYPSVSTETEFPVYTNRVDGYCPGNAWYDPGDESMNFCSSGEGHPNTAWSSVIHHEYGHHLVNMAGSGQGEYGEGMGDVMGLLLSDESGTGFGFFGPCEEPLREADNTMQYPCSGEIHYCGQLLSGCVWSTRNELLAIQHTPGPEYLIILSNLAINSMLLHTGSYITPQITIDWLTLDDDDETIDNGTPHYESICAGFGAHNMTCPELTPVWFEYPDGRPEVVLPNRDTTFRVIVHSSAVEPVSGTGVLYYSIDGAPYQSSAMTEVTPNEYNAILPGSDCYSQIEWYVAAEASGFGTVYNPFDAPSTVYAAFVATGTATVFEDDFESDMGWAVSGGLWARGVPTGGGGEYGGPDPTGGHTDPNVYGYNLYGDYENGMPERHLTSPAIDCSEKVFVHLNFWRWLGVEQPSYDHAYVRVSNNGSTWTTIWENEGTITDGEWTEMDFDISSIADNEPTVYIRFTMGTTDGAWRYCGWNIDDLVVSAYICESTADSDEDGVLDVDDNCPATYNPGQDDEDGDNIGDVCDNCLSAFNPDQEDADGDDDGDSCDVCTDTDGDEYGDPGFPANLCATDNCPSTHNPDQTDFDGDGLGDSCDACTDVDGDGFGDPGFPNNTCLTDNCPTIANADQSDADGDGLGDSCDVCTDTDEDGYGDPGYPANTCEVDNCPGVANPDQADSDDDGVGDLCDACPNDPDDLCCDPQFDNEPPVITSGSSVAVAPGESFEYTAGASDPDCDGTGLDISIADIPSWCSLTELTVSGTAECGYADTTFRVLVSDGELSDMAVVAITVDNSNVAPTIEEVTNAVLHNGITFEFYPDISDPDDTEHTITYPEYPSWCTVQNDSVIGIAPEEASVQTLTVAVADYCKADTMSFEISTFFCGDADQSGEVDIDDAVFLVNYVFAGGPAPEPMEAGDADCSGEVDIDDIVYLVAYIFAGGPEACEGC
jgi:hypothetical protein